MTNVQLGHRSKLQVIPEKGGLVISSPIGAPRVKLGYYPPANKFFLFLGFVSQEDAMKTYNFLLKKRKVGRYNHKTDTGINLPRPAEYFPKDVYKWELKIHRPDANLVDLFIKIDKQRQAELANSNGK